VLQTCAAARVLRRLAAWMRAAAPQSTAGAAWSRWRSGWFTMPSAMRVRAGGIALLAATATNTLLLRAVPLVARPASLLPLRLSLAVIGLVMALAPRAFAQAWTRSGIGRRAARRHQR